MPWITLLVGRHLHHIENYARYPAPMNVGAAEFRAPANAGFFA